MKKLRFLSFLTLIFFGFWGCQPAADERTTSKLNSKTNLQEEQTDTKEPFDYNNIFGEDLPPLIPDDNLDIYTSDFGGTTAVNVGVVDDGKILSSFEAKIDGISYRICSESAVFDCASLGSGDHSIEVAGCNGAGCGESSQAVEVTCPEPPSSNETTSDAIAVSLAAKEELLYIGETLKEESQKFADAQSEETDATKAFQIIGSTDACDIVNDFDNVLANISSLNNLDGGTIAAIVIATLTVTGLAIWGAYELIKKYQPGWLEKMKEWFEKIKETRLENKAQSPTSKIAEVGGNKTPPTRNGAPVASNASGNSVKPVDPSTKQTVLASNAAAAEAQLTKTAEVKAKLPAEGVNAGAAKKLQALFRGRVAAKKARVDAIKASNEKFKAMQFGPKVDAGALEVRKAKAVSALGELSPEVFNVFDRGVSIPAGGDTGAKLRASAYAKAGLKPDAIARIENLRANNGPEFTKMMADARSGIDAKKQAQTAANLKRFTSDFGPGRTAAELKAAKGAGDSFEGPARTGVKLLVAESMSFEEIIAYFTAAADEINTLKATIAIGDLEVVGEAAVEAE